MRSDDDDILSMAQRRKAIRHQGKTGLTGGYSQSVGSGINGVGERRRFPADAVLRIDNYTSGGNASVPLTPSPTLVKKKHEPKIFQSNISDKNNLPSPLFHEDDEASTGRTSLPPLIAVEVSDAEVGALLHSASHVSLISSRLVQRVGVKKEVQQDVVMPNSPIAPNGIGSSWLVEGRLRYVDISIRGTKHVTQLYVARDLPADIILGVDFLRKTQMRLNFPENCVLFPHSGVEVKVPFLSSKELSDYQHSAVIATTWTRSVFSSNF